jgi:hypothetical protein
MFLGTITSGIASARQPSAFIYGQSLELWHIVGSAIFLDNAKEISCCPMMHSTAKFSA